MPAERENRILMQRDLTAELYNIIKHAVEDNIRVDGLTYIEIVGILDKLKVHFTSNATINITDIMVKREIKRNFKNQRDDWCKACRKKIEEAGNMESVPICDKCSKRNLR